MQLLQLSDCTHIRIFCESEFRGVIDSEHKLKPLTTPYLGLLVRAPRGSQPDIIYAALRLWSVTGWHGGVKNSCGNLFVRSPRFCNHRTIGGARCADVSADISFLPFSFFIFLAAQRAPRRYLSIILSLRCALSTAEDG